MTSAGTIIESMPVLGGGYRAHEGGPFGSRDRPSASSKTTWGPMHCCPVLLSLLHGPHALPFHSSFSSPCHLPPKFLPQPCTRNLASPPYPVRQVPVYCSVIPFSWWRTQPLSQSGGGQGQSSVPNPGVLMA